MALQQIDPVSGNDRMADCIDNCFEAAQACEWCVTACTRDPEEDMLRCIELCRDVADVTTLHARITSTRQTLRPTSEEVKMEQRRGYLGGI